MSDFESKFGITPEEFKKAAQELPVHCFEMVLQNSFFLATDSGADPLEMERFKLLQEVQKNRRN